MTEQTEVNAPYEGGTARGAEQSRRGPQHDRHAGSGWVQADGAVCQDAAPMTYEHIELTRSAGVAQLRLNRPERRNAMSPELGREIVRAVAELDGDADLRALIVSGSGKGFSSGGDFDLLAERTRCPADDNRRAMRAFYDAYLAIRELRVPSIAALHGHALGAGLCFALACDLRIAAEDARLGMTFVRVGCTRGWAPPSCSRASWARPRRPSCCSAAASSTPPRPCGSAW
jgi:1,4-dihydroxy-2-naphthoyl-CoA synthase